MSTSASRQDMERGGFLKVWLVGYDGLAFHFREYHLRFGGLGYSLLRSNKKKLKISFFHGYLFLARRMPIWVPGIQCHLRGGP